MHRIKTLTNRSTVNLTLDQLIHVLNPILRGWANYYRHAASSRSLRVSSHYLWWRVIRLRKKYPRLTWKQIRRRCWGHHWTSGEGTRLAWPDEVGVTRYRYRGHRIPSPWATTGTGRATTRPGTAVAEASVMIDHRVSCGEPDARERARPVRRAGRGNGPVATPTPRPRPDPAT